MVKGTQLAVDEINAQGGIKGKKLVVVVADGKLNPDVTATELRRLAYDEKVDVIVGGFSSGIVIANMDTIAEIKKVWLVECASPTVTNKIKEDYDSYKYVFRVGTTNSSTFPPAVVMSLNFLNEKGVKVKKVAIVRDEAKWVADITGLLKKELSANGYEVVLEEAIPKDKEEFSDVLTKVQQNNADIIVAMIAHGKAQAFLMQWKDSGLKIPVAGLVLSAVNPDFWGETNGKCNGLIFIAPASFVPVPEMSEKMKSFVNAYKEKYGTLPEAYSAYGSYNAVYVFKKAYEMALENGEDPSNSDVLVKYLEKVNEQNPVEGVSGNIAFTNHHDLVVKENYIVISVCQWQDGKIVVLHPKATGDLKTVW
jgi:branched-chain amino acid transport system substrate-binding protein